MPKRRTIALRSRVHGVMATFAHLVKMTYGHASSPINGAEDRKAGKENCIRDKVKRQAWNGRGTRLRVGTHHD